jgi:hypothetical protein
MQVNEETGHVFLGFAAKPTCFPRIVEIRRRRPQPGIRVLHQTGIRRKLSPSLPQLQRSGPLRLGLITGLTPQHLLDYFDEAAPADGCDSETAFNCFSWLCMRWRTVTV